jgi:hypothetical protein
MCEQELKAPSVGSADISPFGDGGERDREEPSCRWRY